MSDILQLSPYAPDELNRELEAVAKVHRWWELGKPESIPADIAASITAVATKGDLGLNSALMASLPNLKLISVYGVGFDAIDLEQARTRGIKITTTPGVLTDAVADMAVSLALTASRRIAEGDRFIRDGKWLEGKLGTSFSIRGKNIGIFGYGRIGRRIADILRAFDANILYTDLAPAAGEEENFRANALELAKDSRILIVAAAGGKSTEGLINKDVLEALGPDGLLINVARGSVINEGDLVTALEERKLGHAALDVFMGEPKIKQALIDSLHTTLTPHIASATVETRINMGRNVIANIQAHLAGEELISELKF
ncbi:2-hydroxyacid dehydrogenase [Rhodobacteraceae bacterium RKSG542]|uniref:2-hydroxyacid dehydrogenase n=1 Tax=Pseudovibrio flavus TaxID=2529854 RepID=UPI0012BCF145|nr:2-hydroxyacid dehydrogenase [Pseudovibrio flavus]MTI16025.1 2-hydroxyacid dehydrogenase [Pseudovibrio flavus]